MALAHILHHFRTHQPTPKALTALLQFILFFAVFDGLTTYLTPLLITSHDISTATMGLLIAASSIFGAGFDLILSQLIRQSRYIKIFLYMLILCVAYFLLLATATSIWLYIVVMAFWGLYYDLVNFGIDEFVSSQASLDFHTSYHGLINSFKAIGYVAAPLLAGLVLTNYNLRTGLIIAGTALLLAGFSWFNLNSTIPNDPPHHNRQAKLHPFTEIKRWHRLYPKLKPFLFATFGNHYINAIVWTIGPLFAIVTHQTGLISHLFVLAYMLPTILVGFWVGYISNQLGIFSSSLGTYTLAGLTLCLSLFVYLTNVSPIWLYPILFGTSLLSSISISASRGQITKYIDHHLHEAKDVEGVEDFFVNLGYIAGPLTAGLLISFFSFSFTLFLIGLFSLTLGLLFFPHRTARKYQTKSSL